MLVCTGSIFACQRHWATQTTSKRPLSPEPDNDIRTPRALKIALCTNQRLYILQTCAPFKPFRESHGNLHSNHFTNQARKHSAHANLLPPLSGAIALNAAYEPRRTSCRSTYMWKFVSDFRDIVMEVTGKVVGSAGPSAPSALKVIDVPDGDVQTTNTSTTSSGKSKKRTIEDVSTSTHASTRLYASPVRSC